MCDFFLEVGWQVNDVDGVEWAFLGTDATSYAETLGDEGDFAFGSDFDAELACADYGAGLFALLSAFLWFAL